MSVNRTLHPHSQPTAYRAHATQPTVPSAKRSQGAPVVRRCSARVGGSGAALRVAHPHTHVWAAPDGPAASAERGGPAAHGEAALSRAAAPPRPPALSRHLRRALENHSPTLHQMPMPPLYFHPLQRPQATYAAALVITFWMSGNVARRPITLCKHLSVWRARECVRSVHVLVPTRPSP